MAEAIGRTRTPECVVPWRLSQHLQCKVNLLWTNSVTALYAQVCHNVLREVCLFISFQPLLLARHLTGIFGYEVRSNFSRVHRYEDIGIGSDRTAGFSMICTGDTQVFLCGGIRLPSKRIKSVYLLHANCTIPLADMCIARCHHALYYDEASLSIIAFSGAARTLKCERFRIAARRWSLLPSMAVRRFATSVCGSRGKVYLCGGRTNTCEVFTIATEQFALFATIDIPKGRKLDLFAAAWEGQLYVMYWDTVQCFDLRTGKAEPAKAFPGLQDYSLYQVARDGSVYVLDHSQMNCICIDLRTAAVRSIHIDK